MRAFHCANYSCSSLQNTFSFLQLRVNLDASLESVWDQTNVDASQDTPGKPAVKVSETDQGPSTNLPSRSISIIAVGFVTQYSAQDVIDFNSKLQMKVISELKFSISSRKM